MLFVTTLKNIRQDEELFLDYIFLYKIVQPQPARALWEIKEIYYVASLGFAQ